MTTFVLVHGGWQGGWSYKHVASILRDQGHVVYTPTLTGLGERSHLIHASINLDTHIADVTNTILWEDLAGVVLVGHSYGGMVISGVADRIAERIAALVFLDAVVPRDGSSLFGMRPEYVPLFVERAATGGGCVVRPNVASSFDTRDPTHWSDIDSKTTPHPLACFMQAMRLTGRSDEIRKRVYIYAAGGICDGSYELFRADPAATIVSVEDSGHSIMIDQPQRVADILATITPI